MELWQRLCEFLECDVQLDLRVIFWAVQRRRVLHAVRHQGRKGPRPHLTKGEARAIRYGVDVKPWGGASWTPRLLPPSNGRQPERAVHDANLYLLSVFPQLEHEPLMFAGLERLHQVDRLAAVTSRLPTKEEWDLEKGPIRLNTVTNRARRQLQKARAMLEHPDGRAKVEQPGAQAEARIPAELSRPNRVEIIRPERLSREQQLRILRAFWKRATGEDDLPPAKDEP